MKKVFKSFVIFLLCIQILSVPVWGQQVVAGGQVVGLEISDSSVTVADFDSQLGEMARSGGLQTGDRIVSIDGAQIKTVQDVRQALLRSKGSITLKIQRQGKLHQLRLEPQITADGPKLGILLRQGITGIGTVTFYDPASGRFAMLGHGVNNTAGTLAVMSAGTAYPARVTAVTKGQVGHPGQLQGAIRGRQALGTLYRNTAQGLFGKTEQAFDGPMLEVGRAEEVSTGSATVRATIDGQAVQEYSVEILKIYPNSRQTGRNLMLRVTDPALLDATGGIVQGMSGSPIIQNGKLIGAVTHVLVNQPDTGYGIFIENMLDAAG